MGSEIIVAMLSLIGTFFGTFGGIRLMSYRIEQLERKVEKHNNVIERVAVMENRMTICEHRVDGLSDEKAGCTK